MSRLRRVYFGLRQEISWGFRELTHGRFWWTFNVVGYRVLALSPQLARTWGAPESPRRFHLRTREGIRLTYRAHRGDIQSIREIFIDEIYRLPEGCAPRSLVDLGANIGVATIWIACTYDISDIVCVEPLDMNVSLLRANLRLNGRDATVLVSAVGVAAGTARFSLEDAANMGRVADTGFDVPVGSINDVVSLVSESPALLKMDIEGMEGPLVCDTDGAWIDRFDFLVTELHPEYVDLNEVIARITQRGYDYTPSNEVTRGAYRMKRERLFVRRS